MQAPLSPVEPPETSLGGAHGDSDRYNQREQQRANKRRSLLSENSSDNKVTELERQLKEAQEERKKRVDELCEKLESCRRYYMWHAAEVDEGDVASTF